MSGVPHTRKHLESFQNSLVNQFYRLRLNEHTFMVLIAVLIGVLGGFGAIFFRFAIRFFEGMFFQTWDYSLSYALKLPWYIKLGAPVIGGIMVGPIVYIFAREAKGHGVPEVMESIVLRGGAIRPRVMIAKVFASAISIGSGGSVGREGPIVQIGSAIGSTFGQLLKVTGSHLRTLVACGTAAGIAGTFNAPIAGALFAMEIILSDFGISQFSPIVVASVSATVVSRHFLGDFPAFVIPQYQLVSVFEMIPYALLGVLAAFVALAFINLLYKTEDIFEALPIPGFVKPAIGGALIGLMGILFPYIFGVGYDTISLALESRLAWYFLLLLVALKLLATSITIGSGGSGGIFAPSLFLGASLGGFVGTVVHVLFPTLTASSGAYALVGMGAVAAGAMHAPITSILIIFELTNDYRIILPLMIACIISVLITTRLKKDSIYTLKLSRRGINLFQGQEINILKGLRVAQVMKPEFEVVRINTPFNKLMDLTVTSSHSNFFVIDNQERLIGVVSVQDLRKIIFEKDTLEPFIIALDLMLPAPRFFTPEDTLDVVTMLFSEMNIAEAPVVNNREERKIIGVISKDEVMRAYNEEIFKRDTVTSVSSYISSLETFKSVEMSHGHLLCEIEAPGSFINKNLKMLDLRNRMGIEVILIKQKFNPEKKEWQNIFTPTPDYRFKFGDTLLIMGQKDAIDKLKNSRFKPSASGR